MGMLETLPDQPANDSPSHDHPGTYRFIVVKDRPPTPSHVDAFPGGGEQNGGISQAFNADFFNALAECERLSRPPREAAQTLQTVLIGLRALQTECMRTANPVSSKLAIDGFLTLAAQSLSSALGIAAENGGTYDSQRMRQDSMARLTQAVQHADQFLKHTACLIYEDKTFSGAESLLSGLRLVREELQNMGGLKLNPCPEMSAIAPTLDAQ